MFIVRARKRKTRHESARTVSRSRTPPRGAWRPPTRCRTGYGEGYNTVLPRAQQERLRARRPAGVDRFCWTALDAARRTIPTRRKTEKESERNHVGETGAEERTVEPRSGYGAGERRKQSVRLISAAGADKAFVHSPLQRRAVPRARERERRPRIRPIMGGRESEKERERKSGRARTGATKTRSGKKRESATMSERRGVEGPENEKGEGIEEDGRTAGSNGRERGDRQKKRDSELLSRRQRDRRRRGRVGRHEEIRSTIHRAIALALAWRSATPSCRRYIHTPSGLLLINNALCGPHYN